MNEYSLASITEEIASHLKKELDEPFKRILADKVHAWRATLIRRTLRDNPRERSYFRQSFYMKLEKISAVPDCIDPSAPVCPVMRSALKLPAAVRAGSMVYDYVGAIDGQNPFRKIDPGTSQVLSAGKYSKNLPMYDEVNDYLEVYNAVNLPFVRVDGIFDNPEQVEVFNCESGLGGCDTWNLPYPVSGDIKQAIVECILKVDYQQPVTPSNKEIQVTPQKQEHAPDGR